MDLLDALDLARIELDPRVAAVREDQWALPTPCDDWDVRALLDHIVGSSRFAAAMARGVDREQASAAVSADNLGSDPLGSYRAALDAHSDAFRAAADDLDRPVQHPTLPMTVGRLLGFRIIDLTVHGWDLARAIGADDTIDPRLLDTVWAIVEPILPMVAASGVFGEGPSGNVGAAAPLQLRVLDTLGRRP